MNQLRFRRGDWVTWKDSNRTMIGKIKDAFQRSRTPNAYYIIVGGRTFMRYEPYLTKTGAPR
jgi:hypothetical protein